MNRIFATYSVLFLLLAGLSSCDELLNVEIVGDGNVKTESRDLGAFDRLYLESDFEVILANGEQSVAVEADSNLMPYIMTEIVDRELDISIKTNFNIVPRQGIRIYLTVPKISPSLSEVEVIDGGKVLIDSLTLDGQLDVQVYGVSYFFADTIVCPQLSLVTEGSTSVNINGSFEQLSVSQRGSGNLNLLGYSPDNDIVLEGSGKIDAKSMKMEDADISVYGSGLILCRVSGLLDAMIGGSGRIYYYGNPSELKKQITGDGLVLPGED